MLSHTSTCISYGHDDKSITIIHELMPLIETDDTIKISDEMIEVQIKFKNRGIKRHIRIEPSEIDSVPSDDEKDEDYVVWCDNQLKQKKCKMTVDLDIDALIEEILRFEDKYDLVPCRLKKTSPNLKLYKKCADENAQLSDKIYKMRYFNRIDKNFMTEKQIKKLYDLGIDMGHDVIGCSVTKQLTFARRAIKNIKDGNPPKMWLERMKSRTPHPLVAKLLDKHDIKYKK